MNYEVKSIRECLEGEKKTNGRTEEFLKDLSKYVERDNSGFEEERERVGFIMSTIFRVCCVNEEKKSQERVYGVYGLGRFRIV